MSNRENSWTWGDDNAERPWWYAFTIADLRRLSRRHVIMRRLVEALRERNEEYETLLNRALQELALERGEPPPQFIARWLRENRTFDRSGLPHG